MLTPWLCYIWSQVRQLWMNGDMGSVTWVQSQISSYVVPLWLPHPLDLSELLCRHAPFWRYGLPPGICSISHCWTWDPPMLRPSWCCVDWWHVLPSSVNREHKSIPTITLHHIRIWLIFSYMMPCDIDNPKGIRRKQRLPSWMSWVMHCQSGSRVMDQYPFGVYLLTRPPVTGNWCWLGYIILLYVRVAVCCQYCVSFYLAGSHTETYRVLGVRPPPLCWPCYLVCGWLGAVAIGCPVMRRLLSSYISWCAQFWF